MKARHKVTVAAVTGIPLDEILNRTYLVHASHPSQYVFAFIAGFAYVILLLIILPGK